MGDIFLSAIFEGRVGHYYPKNVLVGLYSRSLLVRRQRERLSKIYGALFDPLLRWEVHGLCVSRICGPE